MLNLSKVADRVYHLSIEDPYVLAMSFLRYQEIYESPNPDFQNKMFTISEYLSWYNKQYGTEYHKDWTGFNLPVKVISRYSHYIKDYNKYDEFMQGVVYFIEREEPDSYLIGTKSFDKNTLKHELTHALYYTNKEYKNEVLNCLYTEDPYYKPKIVDKLQDIISKAGYAKSSVDDEINAYITTGDNGYFKNIRSKEFANLKKELKDLHNKYYEF